MTARATFGIALALCLVLALVPLAPAAEPFTGEVLKVDVSANKFTVKKPDGNRFTFVVNDKTAYTGSRKSLKDLATGDKVTVEFSVSGGQYIASKVSTP